VCILRDAEVGFCIKEVVSYNNLDSIKVPLSKKLLPVVDIIQQRNCGTLWQQGHHVRISILPHT
jgi:hypothetical protein